MLNPPRARPERLPATPPSRWPASGPPPVSRLHCDTGLLRVGSFAVHPDDPRFAAGMLPYHELAFPRTSVWLHDPRRPPFVADPTVVTYYNGGSPYARRKVSGEGDHCDWFGVEAHALLELLRQHDPSVDDRPHQPFPFTHGPCDATSYRLQRLVIAHVTGNDPPDALFIEELMLRVLDHLLRLAFSRHRLAPPVPSSVRPPAGPARDLAERAQVKLADRFAEPLTLAALARELGCSAGYLCRAFHAATGTTLARYRTELRLRHALEHVAEPRADLAAVAFDSGFSSHSHFTAAFHATFGEPPSSFRRAASHRRLAAAKAARPRRLAARA